MGILCKKLSSFYSADHIMQVARESGFVKRSRKLNPGVFLDSLLFNEFDNGLVSLNDHSVDIQIRHATSIRKQSLDERFNNRSVTFVKSLLEEQLKTQLSGSLSSVCLKRFSSVKLKDSSRFQLPACLKDAYPGSGGNASDAGIHIQFEFDIKTGKVNTIKSTDAKHQDVTDAVQTVADVQAGSLLIRDLGYFSTKLLETIAVKQKAYYISRLPPHLKVSRYTNGRFELLDLAREHKEMKRCGMHCKELEVYIGDNKLPVRLLIELIPEANVEERMRKAIINAKRKGRTLSQDYKTYASLGLFITNVPQKWLATEHIRSVYRLRWQIELRFKCWKGLCHVHAIKKMKLHRFETYLYARLLYILLHWEISIALLNDCWQTKRKMLSIYKCYKALLQFGDILRNTLFQCPKNMACYFTTIKCIDVKNLLLEKRKGNLAFYEILLTRVEKNKDIITFESGTCIKKTSRIVPNKNNTRLLKKARQI